MAMFGLDHFLILQDKLNGSGSLMSSRVWADRILQKLYEGYLIRSYFKSPEEISKYQSYRLRRLVIHAFRNIPFYQKWFTVNGISPSEIKTVKDLKRIPPVDKNLLRSHPTSFVTSSVINRDRYSKRITSGSTGEPISFYLDRRYGLFKMAAMRRFFRVNDIPFDTKKVLLADEDFFRSVRFEYNVPIASLLKNPEKTLKYIKDLNAKVLIGYASILLEFSKYAVEMGIKFNFRHTVSFAEQLTPAARKLIEENLSTTVFNYYAATEVGIIGFECRERDGFHLNNEAVVVEIEPDLPETPGAVIVTSMVNDVMPFIRYKLGDSGYVKNGFCPCGSSFAKIFISGRASEIFSTPARRVHHFEFSNVLKKFGHTVEAFQIAPQGGSTVILKIVSSSLRERDKTAIITELQKEIGPHINFRIENISKIERLPRGKLRMVV